MTSLEPTSLTPAMRITARTPAGMGQEHQPRSAEPMMAMLGEDWVSAPRCGFGSLYAACLLAMQHKEIANPGHLCALGLFEILPVRDR